MSQSLELHRLVIQNLSVLEDAPKIASEVEIIVFSAIDKKIEKWVCGKPGWDGKFHYLEDGLTAQPKSWGRVDDDNYNAYYDFGCYEYDKVQFYLSTLLGIVEQQFGMYFGVRAEVITRLSGKGTTPARKWKNFLAERYSQTKLKEFGFELRAESLFMPIRIDTKELVEAYPDSLDDALAPIDEALEKLEAAHPGIDALLQSALEHQF